MFISVRVDKAEIRYAALGMFWSTKVKDSEMLL